MEKSDKIMLAMVQDRIDQCNDYGILGNTGFLDFRQRTMAEDYCKKIKGLHYQFDGGYEDAERRIFVVFPEGETQENLLAVLRITKSGSKELSHRDYMGSILSLGIKREMIGDILVNPEGAEILILKDLADFFLSNYDKAGSTPLTVKIGDLREISPGDENAEEVRETLASLRLDNVISAAFKISRSRASEAISGGLVYINGQQWTKLDKLVNQGDKVVLRGKGKIVLQELLANNKKDKRVAIIKKYR